jgi:hypothetical protein
MTAEPYEAPLTPVQVEQELMKLLKSNQSTYVDLRDAEKQFEQANATHQIAFARALLETYKYDDQKAWSVARREAAATVATEGERIALAAATALVKAARAKAAAVRTQADIIRSIGTSVRTSMTMEG